MPSSVYMADSITGPPPPSPPPVSPPHLLHPLRPLPRGRHAVTAHATLLRPHLWLSFTLPSRLARVTKPINIERAYARSLKPVVSSLWLQRILLPSPASPTTSRRDAYFRLYNVDVQRRDLYRLALYLGLLSTLASIPSFTCDAKAPPSLPTKSSSHPTAGTFLTNSASALTAPHYPG